MHLIFNWIWTIGKQSVFINVLHEVRRLSKFCFIIIPPASFNKLNKYMQYCHCVCREIVHTQKKIDVFMPKTSLTTFFQVQHIDIMAYEFDAYHPNTNNYWYACCTYYIWIYTFGIGLYALLIKKTIMICGTEGKVFKHFFFFFRICWERRRKEI